MKNIKCNLVIKDDDLLGFITMGKKTRPHRKGKNN